MGIDPCSPWGPRNTPHHQVSLCREQRGARAWAGDASPEGRVGEGVRGQVAGVVVGSSSGGVQAERG